jgi:cytoskeleton protein RodZ
MESVGQKLRNARSRSGSTLEAVSATTRIPLHKLEAIENDRLDQLSSRFIYKSFVRQFAQAVGLDDASLETPLQTAIEAIPESLFPGQPGAPVPPKVAGLRPQRTRTLRWILSFGSLVVMVAACSTVYSMWETSRSGQASPGGSPSVAGHQQPSNAPAHNAAPQPPATTTADPLREPAKESVENVKSANPEDAPLRNADRFQIQLSALERTWLSVVTDGREVYSGILQASESKTLEGHETARVRTGNAGGVEVVFNGRTIGTLGSKGQVRTVLFTKNGYEVLDQPHIALAHFITGDQ